MRIVLVVTLAKLDSQELLVAGQLVDDPFGVIVFSLQNAQVILKNKAAAAPCYYVSGNVLLRFSHILLHANC